MYNFLLCSSSYSIPWLHANPYYKHTICHFPFLLIHFRSFILYFYHFSPSLFWTNFDLTYNLLSFLNTHRSNEPITALSFFFLQIYIIDYCNYLTLLYHYSATISHSFYPPSTPFSFIMHPCSYIYSYLHAFCYRHLPPVARNARRNRATVGSNSSGRSEYL